MTLRGTNLDNTDNMISTESLASWVTEKTSEWRDHYDMNYREKHEEYYRIWRGIHSDQDSMRKSERSKLINPATQQAIESSAAEIEEATFGRGRFFDITDDYGDQDPNDIEFLKNQLTNDFKKAKTRRAVSDVVTNSAVYGTGVAEIVMETIRDVSPATQPVEGTGLAAYGINVRNRLLVKLRPVDPMNFLIDPSAASIDDALGVAFEDMVPEHKIIELQEQGVYRNVDFYTEGTDYQLESEQGLIINDDTRVHVVKYYGLVPRYLLDEEMAELGEDEELVSLTPDDEKDTTYVEAVVVIANGDTVLKAEESPFMMQDRPVIAFPWDSVPGKFWGRGVAEKGYHSQKALDAEMRARIDGLALTMHPMMAADATRLPRGSKFEIRPGKTVLTNGNPAEILQPFKFGEMSQNTFNQAAALRTMIQEATGAVDSQGGFAGNEGTAAGLSMSLGSILKRHKRTLNNFQEQFLVPLIEKTAWRYMQFAPDLYPVNDYNFTPQTSLGIIAREYEVTQLVQLLQTMGQDNPAYPQMLEAIIDHMNLSNREVIIETLRQAAQVSPEEQEAAQRERQLGMEQIQSQIDAFRGQALESEKRAEKYAADIETNQYKAETERLKALSPDVQPGDEDDKEFERRFRTAELLLRERELDFNLAGQAEAKAEAAQAKQAELDLMSQLQTMNTQGDI